MNEGMWKNESIEIRQVGNGFEVLPADRHPSMPIDPKKTMVFQTMAELVLWLPTQFDHRKHAIKVDEKAKP